MPDREKVIKGLEQFRADLKPFCGNHADWERFDAALIMLKEQEAEIRQLKLALDIAKGTCKGIKSGGGQFADIPTMQSATQSKGW